MADISRDVQNDTTTALPGTATSAQSTLPPGMVLGPDGKPCRSCTSKSAFSAWTAQAKTMKAPSAAATTTATSTPAPSTATTTTDCPADVETLGRNSWTLLHSIAATYPTSPTPAQQDDVVGFIKLFSKLYPCWVCAEDFKTYIRKDPVKAGSRGEFGKWLCDAHNHVNKKLGKPVFDCSRWEERWRTGWKDGRCD
ncbi:augmenter of liver regeneration [Coniella lustricola]|uniref:Sulfhydryl oxidase n=1 Tax=Coniella lustricola TaxID=2025994 RepID=A0A2T3A7V7_9PEZI|nr:augmenter of liver regeneration [Coniella lustricola]